MSDNEQRTNAYPTPPFPEQPQTPPGLASEMEPVPDHGEKSYKGHGRLAGKKALITGGDSGIGRAVLMNPLMILVKIIKLRWIHILSYDQMVSRKI
ncbi:hypothetical protein SPM73_03765, partial [Enterobacter hormaechei subsp. xiangfangensis]